MTFTSLLRHHLVATFFIAACALPNWATAQNLFGNPAVQAIGAVVATPEVRAELMAWAPDGVSAGKQVWLGLQLTHIPQWHTYWKNPGDSGLPTMLEWALPDGIAAGEIAWPLPKKIPIGTLANYGYENTVLLPVPLTVAASFAASELSVKLKASWLVCKEACIPQEGEFALTIPAQSSTASNAGAFEAAFEAAPKSLPAGASAVSVEGQRLSVSLAGLPTVRQGKTLAFFPETAGITEPAAPVQQSWQGALWQGQMPLSGQRTESPALLPVVVAAGGSAYRIEAPVSGSWPAVASATVISPALDTALKANAATGAAPASNSGNAAPVGLLVALIGALLGGMLLNLMPCVLPVLAIKVVGFVQIKDPAARVSGGLAYTAGVVLSFLALGALLLGFRAAGEQLGWGFQLQNPAVVAGLALLFTVVGLNLAGLFEFGNFLPSRLANLQSGNPRVNAFLSGVLTTAIASPCTAPFMGASLGYAIALPGAQALAVFAALGLGMALPFLLASVVPGVARALPRPGPWMVTFKQAMAFPMFATVAWLVWVLGQQSGINGAGALLAILVLVALAIWAINLPGRSRPVAAALSFALLAGGVWAIGGNIVKALPDGAPSVSAVQPGNAVWQAWEPGRVEQLTAQGQNVFVDFTAAWCVTCQYNKQTTLSDQAVLADMAAKKVTLLRADWTRRDPAVSAALSQLGRSGVPVYVIYKPGRAPVVLSEILSVDDVRAELARL